MAGGEYVEKAKIGRAIMDADVFISLSHFKGHEQTGFGGALKKYWHGVREPPGQDGAALRRKAGGEAEALRRLPPVHQAVRAGRYLLRWG